MTTVEEIQKLKKREECCHSGTLLCAAGGAGNSRLYRGFFLPEQGSNEAPRKDNRILWRFFHGRKCEDPESKEESRNGRRSCRLSDGTHGRRR